MRIGRLIIDILERIKDHSNKSNLWKTSRWYLDSLQFQISDYKGCNKRGSLYATLCGSKLVPYL